MEKTSPQDSYHTPVRVPKRPRVPENLPKKRTLVIDTLPYFKLNVTDTTRKYFMRPEIAGHLQFLMEDYDRLRGADVENLEERRARMREEYLAQLRVYQNRQAEGYHPRQYYRRPSFFTAEIDFCKDFLEFYQCDHEIRFVTDIEGVPETIEIPTVPEEFELCLLGFEKVTLFKAEDITVELEQTINIWFVFSRKGVRGTAEEFKAAINAANIVPKDSDLLKIPRPPLRSIESMLLDYCLHSQSNAGQNLVVLTKSLMNDEPDPVSWIRAPVPPKPQGSADEE